MTAMDIQLLRKELTTESTIGEMLINGTFHCFTLEDVVRTGPKIYGNTAIPEGKYQVIINMSNRFKREMPLLIGVPGFEGVRIHSGNTSEDTEGCILVGMHKLPNKIYNCSPAYDGLMIKLKRAFFNEEKVFITIKNN